MFIILTGSSGVGKNTIIKHLEERNLTIKLMPTFTTRDKRPGEIEGMPYFYLTKDIFQQKIRNKEFIEYEIIHENYYGSSYKIFDKYISEGHCLIKDIGVEGAENLSIKLADRTEILKLFLTTKHKRDLIKRLAGRGEKQIALRLKRYDYEQKQKNKFDYIILNNNLEKTLDTILQIKDLTINNFFPYKKLHHVCSYKINRNIKKIQAGKILKPIKIIVSQNNAYIVNGLDRFIATSLCGKTIAKLVVDKKNFKNIKCSLNWLDDYKKL